MVSECCLASLSFSLLSLRHRGAAESQTSIGRRCHVAEWLTELNEGVWRNKRLFVWCLVVLSSDSYIKAALVCGDLRLSYLFLSSYFSWGFLIWSLYRSDSSLHEIHPSGSLWNQATISTSFVCEKQKIVFWFWQVRKQEAFSEQSFAYDWSPQSPRPACPSLGRPAICSNRPNEARPSPRSSETPPPHWPNQPQKASAPPALSANGPGHVSAQIGHFINTRRLMN